MPSKKKTPITAHVANKAKRASTYAAISGLLAGLATVFPQYGAALQAGALVAGAVGTFMPQPSPGGQEGAP